MLMPWVPIQLCSGPTLILGKSPSLSLSFSICQMGMIMPALSALQSSREERTLNPCLTLFSSQRPLQLLCCPSRPAPAAKGSVSGLPICPGLVATGWLLLLGEGGPTFLQQPERGLILPPSPSQGCRGEAGDQGGGDWAEEGLHTRLTHMNSLLCHTACRV